MLVFGVGNSPPFSDPLSCDLSPSSNWQLTTRIPTTNEHHAGRRHTAIPLQQCSREPCHHLSQAMSVLDLQHRQLSDDPSWDQPILTLPPLPLEKGEISAVGTLGKWLNLLTCYFRHKGLKVPSTTQGCSMNPVRWCMCSAWPDLCLLFTDSEMPSRHISL